MLSVDLKTLTYHFVGNDGRETRGALRSPQSAHMTAKFYEARGHYVRITQGEDHVTRKHQHQKMLQRHAELLHVLDASGQFPAMSARAIPKMVELGYLGRDELDGTLYITDAGRAHMEQYPAPHEEMLSEIEAANAYPIRPASALSYKELMALTMTQKAAVLTDLGTQEQRERLVGHLSKIADCCYSGSINDLKLMQSLGLIADPGNGLPFEVTPLGKFAQRYTNKLESFNKKIEAAKAKPAPKAKATAKIDVEPISFEPEPPVFETVDELKRTWKADPFAFNLQDAAKASGFSRLHEELRRFEAATWYEKYEAMQAEKRTAVANVDAQPSIVKVEHFPPRSNPNAESLIEICADALEIIDDTVTEYGKPAVRILRVALGLLDEVPNG